jgi:glucokinase
LYAEMFRGTRADDVFSTRGLLSRLSSVDPTIRSVESGAQQARDGDSQLKLVFRTFGNDLGEFLNPYVLRFKADGVIISGGITEALDLFFNALFNTLYAPLQVGSLQNRAAFYGLASVVFRNPNTGEKLIRRFLARVRRKESRSRKDASG